MAGKFGFIIVTHGDSGGALLTVARYILGDKLGDFVAIRLPFKGEMAAELAADSLTPFADRRQWLKERLLAARAQVDKGEGVIVFTDIIGGTAFSVASEAFPAGEAVIIGGVNLPMLLKAPYLESATLEEAAREFTVRSRQAIDWRVPGKR